MWAMSNRRFARYPGESRNILKAAWGKRRGEYTAWRRYVQLSPAAAHYLLLTRYGPQENEDEELSMAGIVPQRKAHRFGQNI
jgi:hypothetical protein